MKKGLILICLGASLLAFAGCSNNNVTTSEEATSEVSSTSSEYVEYSGEETMPWAGVYVGYTTYKEDLRDIEATLTLHSDMTGKFVLGDETFYITVTNADKFTSDDPEEREIFCTDTRTNTEWSLLYKEDDDQWAGSVCGCFTARYDFTPFNK